MNQFILYHISLFRISIWPVLSYWLNNYSYLFLLHNHHYSQSTYSPYIWYISLPLSICMHFPYRRSLWNPSTLPFLPYSIEWPMQTETPFLHRPPSRFSSMQMLREAGRQLCVSGHRRPSTHHVCVRVGECYLKYTLCVCMGACLWAHVEVHHACTCVCVLCIIDKCMDRVYWTTCVLQAKVTNILF